MRKTLSRFGTIALAATTLLTACNGSEEDPNEPLFEMPQILPDRIPLCASYLPTQVGVQESYFLLLSNEGRQDLIISGATLENDERGFMEIGGIQPMSVEFGGDSAVLQLKYVPQEEGWDAADIVVNSNAQNYQALRVFVLALARPEGADETWDPGPKPAVATQTDPEACSDEFRGRE